MAFLTEPEPARGVVIPVIPGIGRIVAANPGPMTYHGTNTYLIDGPDGTTVLDPGPADPAHVQHILAATGGKVVRILLSHTHRDHVGALAALQAATGARSHAFHRSAAPGFAPDVPLRDGDEVAGWTALHTPGHAADHLCFARADGVVFTADHIMSWSSSIVSPPDGDMSAYFASLRRMLARDDRLYLSGHGPPRRDTRAYAQHLLDHRLQREGAIVTALAEAPQDTLALVDRLYAPVNPRLRGAAERNVLAHLLKLRDEGRALQDGTVWRAA
ncbi:MBL fold metallo-hydrolase [Limobrevibacterium gyesilva]|uniref:MBL fold metallo-hydrolase n=1 Tax=Limobrevibacterium gyesilva TaxID=2991712 RepID=A0AA42CET6_9PROT|nr:MBL fold metallo-hydrolase [Limobrevibacterium gyesilva]MCW3476448.1 MBL fold metallo-hydrolase [Limobrevibacterium gyesilva]